MLWGPCQFTAVSIPHVYDTKRLNSIFEKILKTSKIWFRAVYQELIGRQVLDTAMMTHLSKWSAIRYWIMSKNYMWLQIQKKDNLAMSLLVSYFHLHNLHDKCRHFLLKCDIRTESLLVVLNRRHQMYEKGD